MRGAAPPASWDGDAPLSFLELHMEFRVVAHDYASARREEEDLLETLRELEDEYHRQLKQLRYLSGWSAYLRTGDASHIDRNEWDDTQHIETQLPFGDDLYRYSELVQAVRDHPELVGLMAVHTSSEALSPKLKELTGSNEMGTEAAARARSKLRKELAETLCFSLFGSMHTRSERALFRTALQEAFFAEAKASGVGVAAALLTSAAATQQGDPSSAAAKHLDSSGAVPFFLSSERQGASFALELLRTSLQRHSAEFLACMFQEPLAAMLQHKSDLDLRTPDLSSPLDGPDSPHKSQRRSKLSRAKRSRSQYNLAARGGASDGSGNDNSSNGPGPSSRTSTGQQRRTNSNPRSNPGSRKGSSLLNRAQSISNRQSSISGRTSTHSHNHNAAPKSSRFSRAVTWLGRKRTQAQNDDNDDDDDDNGPRTITPSSHVEEIQALVCDEAAEQQRTLCCRACDRLLACVSACTMQWPLDVKVLVGDAVITMQVLWPGCGNRDVLRLVWGLLYKHLMIPSMARPHKSGVFSEPSPTVSGKHNVATVLSLFEWVLQSAASVSPRLAYAKQVQAVKACAPEERGLLGLNVHILHEYVCSQLSSTRKHLGELARVCVRVAQTLPIAASPRNRGGLSCFVDPYLASPHRAGSRPVSPAAGLASSAADNGGCSGNMTYTRAERRVCLTLIEMVRLHRALFPKKHNQKSGEQQQQQQQQPPLYPRPPSSREARRLGLPHPCLSRLDALESLPTRPGPEESDECLPLTYALKVQYNHTLHARGRLVAGAAGGNGGSGNSVRGASGAGAATAAAGDNPRLPTLIRLPKLLGKIWVKPEELATKSAADDQGRRQTQQRKKQEQSLDVCSGNGAVAADDSYGKNSIEVEEEVEEAKRRAEAALAHALANTLVQVDTARGFEGSPDDLVALIKHLTQTSEARMQAAAAFGDGSNSIMGHRVGGATAQDVSAARQAKACYNWNREAVNISTLEALRGALEGVVGGVAAGGGRGARRILDVDGDADSEDADDEEEEQKQNARCITQQSVDGMGPLGQLTDKGSASEAAAGGDNNNNDEEESPRPSLRGLGGLDCHRPDPLLGRHGGNGPGCEASSSRANSVGSMSSVASTFSAHSAGAGLLTPRGSQMLCNGGGGALPVDAASIQALKRVRHTLAQGLQQLQTEHERTWRARRRALQGAVQDARVAMAGLIRECSLNSRVLFHSKVLAFCSSVAVPCRMALPASMRPPLPPGQKVKKADLKAQLVFEAASVDGFIAQYQHFSHGLRSNPTTGAKVYHSFLRLTRRALLSDVAFTEPEVDSALEVVETHVCTRLYDLMFCPDTRGDAAFAESVRRAAWLEPSHLGMECLPQDPPAGSHDLWARPVAELARLPSTCSPRLKLACLTRCIKWLPSVVHVKGLPGAGNFDADMSISALIYAIKCAPTHFNLVSTLNFLDLFLPPSDVYSSNSEGDFCLTQFQLATNYINTLGPDPPQDTQDGNGSPGRRVSVSRVMHLPNSPVMRSRATSTILAHNKQQGGGGDATGLPVTQEVAAGPVWLTLLLCNRAWRARFLALVSTEDLVEVNLVCRGWRDCTRSVLLLRSLGADGGAGGLGGMRTAPASPGWADNDALMVAVPPLSERTRQRRRKKALWSDDDDNGGTLANLG